MSFSIVITGNHWSHLLHLLIPVLDYKEKYQTELIFVSSTPVPIEDIPSRPDLKILIVQDTDIFKLRLEGIKNCNGTWIILIEDHNEIEAGWISSLYSNITANPTALAFVTPIKNGTVDSAIDEANFLFNFSAYLPEMIHLLLDRHPVIAGACFKKSIVPDWDVIKEGELELKILPGLYMEGKTIFIRNNFIIHIQSNSLVRTLLKHFYNAKACAGLLKEMNHNQIDREALKRSLEAPFFFYRKWTHEPYRLILNSGYKRCLPYLILIGIVFGFGSTLGWLFGKGRSALNLE
ncbi:MAG: glycosyltransferase [Saprospiraceae bacterium]